MLNKVNVSQRILRVNQVIRKEISNLILREFDFPKGVFVTVSRVECSPNLIQAKVYLLFFPPDKGKELLKILNKKIWLLQKKLDKLLKMKPVPKIVFIPDKTTPQIERLEELLEQIERAK